jgi:hypothetical protein
MKLFKAIVLFLAACLPACAATYSITPSTPLATIQAELAATGPNTYNFAAGNYAQITSTLTLPCGTGNVYQGAPATFVPGVGVSPTTIFNAAFTGSNLARITGNSSQTVPGAGCTVDSIWFENQNVYVQPPVSGLLFTHNKISGIVGSLKGSGNTTSWAGVYIDNGTTQDIGYSAFQWNTFGPSCTDIDATIGTDYGGTCGGIIVHGSNGNLTVANNNVSGQIEEFFHTLAQGNGGQISKNLTIVNNDMGYVHRIGIELQQQDVQGAVVKFNDMRDEYNPAQFSFLISAACCGPTGGSTSPGVLIQDNVLFNNVPLSTGESYNVGYGIELWGNGSQATGNLLQSLHFANAIALGGFSGSTSAGLVATNNTIQGNITAPNCEYNGCQYISGQTVSPNAGSSTISAVSLASPIITLAGNVFTIAGPAALNSTVWFTTDGTTPVPGQGTSQVYSTSITAASAMTVKAVSMWGTGANPYSYAAGYGYAPSPVTSAPYTPAPPPPAPTVYTYTFPPASYSATIGPDGTLTVVSKTVLQ